MVNIRMVFMTVTQEKIINGEDRGTLFVAVKGDDKCE